MDAAQLAILKGKVDAQSEKIEQQIRNHEERKQAIAEDKLPIEAETELDDETKDEAESSDEETAIDPNMQPSSLDDLAVAVDATLDPDILNTPSKEE